MKEKNSQKTKRPFFEGWYFKHSCKNETIAFIVGRNIDVSGAGSAFIQVITQTKSYNVNYPIETFKNFKKRFVIRVGDSYFTENGVFININSEDLKITGKITYTKLSPLKYSIMGPLKAFSKMECQHEIISMHHRLFGKLNFNSEIINFDNGIGYIESDAGHSFPKKYTWLQCNNFTNINASIMTAVAEIPILKANFNGAICVINYKNKEYRLATYLGAKVDFCNNYCIIIKQRKFKLVIKLCDTKGHRLLAPKDGNMTRIIYESVCANAKFWFYEGDELIFFGNSDKCSYEIVKKKGNIHLFYQ